MKKHKPMNENSDLGYWMLDSELFLSNIQQLTSDIISQEFFRSRMTIRELTHNPIVVFAAGILMLAAVRVSADPKTKALPTASRPPVIVPATNAVEKSKQQPATSRPNISSKAGPVADKLKESKPLFDGNDVVMNDLRSEDDVYWQRAKNIVYKNVLDLLSQNKAELDKGIAYHKLLRGDATKKRIAITFDDGPHVDFTPKLLEILKRYNVKATFFVVGEMAEKEPDLVRAELAAGHSVGNHTYHHVDLTKIPPVYVATEIKACGEVIRSITGKSPHLFRPPGGDYNNLVAQVAVALDYVTVLWTDDPGDYANPGESILTARLTNRVSPGGIILIHDGSTQTINILPSVIKNLKDRGFKFVTIDEMLGRK
jgi:peptidoglycan-N-acetylglucosamine deacetylase